MVQKWNELPRERKGGHYRRCLDRNYMAIYQKYYKKDSCTTDDLPGRHQGPFPILIALNSK